MTVLAKAANVYANDSYILDDHRSVAFKHVHYLQDDPTYITLRDRSLPITPVLINK